MSKRSWIRNLFARPVTRPMGRVRHRACLGVEALETRLTPAMITVTSLADNTTADGQVTLREAIQAAETDTSVDGSTAGSGADTIVFAPALAAGGPATINLMMSGDGSQGLSAFLVDTPITIQGPTGSNGITLSGPGTGGVLRLFLVNGPGNLTIENLTLTGGDVDVPDSMAVPLANAGGCFLLQPGSKLTLTDSTIDNNVASDGGGIRMEGATLQATGSTISHNGATQVEGGGIENLNGGTATLTNCTVYKNGASLNGGGIADFRAGVTLTNCTVSENSTGGSIGGVYNNSGTLTLNNTIVANNSGNNVIGQTGGSHNLIAPLFSSIPLGPLQNNGGPTKTQALPPGSAAIDAGDNALIPAGITTDQRGSPRIGGGTVDIGAFEVQPAPPPPVVTGPAAATTVDAAAFTVAGTAAADSLVRVYRGSMMVGRQQLAGGATAFAISVPLNQGAANDFAVTATSVDQNESATTAVPTITEINPSPVPQIAAVAFRKKGKAKVRVTDAATGALRAILVPFGGFTGRVQLSLKDVNGDGTRDLIVKAVIDGKLKKKVYDGRILAPLSPKLA